MRRAEKTPAGKEDLVRAYVLTKALEALGCTMEKFEAAENMGKQEYDAEDEDDLFQDIDQLEAKQPTSGSPGKKEKKNSKPLVVIDAQNLAMKHGRDKVFSTRGILIAVAYWRGNGHKVVGFLPEYLFDYEKVNAMKAAKKFGNKIKEQKCPDDVSVLCNLEKEGVLTRTPGQDYDDSYCIEYARRFDAFMVTNDRFRDYLENVKAKVADKDT